MALVEGVGEEVLFTFLAGLLVLLLIMIYFWRRREEDLTDEADVGDRPPVYNDTTCPICFCDHTYPVETNCGHVFCGICFKTYHTRNTLGNSGVNCPLCRQRVGVLFLCFRIDQGNNVVIRNEVVRFVRRYNRIMSNSLTIWEQFCEIPVLLRHLFLQLMDGNDLAIYYIRIRIFLYISATIMYILMPYDIFPEIVFGIYGYIEDVLAVVVLLYYLARFYRGFLGDE